MATAIVPGIYDDTLADNELTARTEDAYATARYLARREVYSSASRPRPMSMPPCAWPSNLKQASW